MRLRICVVKSRDCSVVNESHFNCYCTRNITLSVQRSWLFASQLPFLCIQQCQVTGFRQGRDSLNSR